jgi:flagellar basal body-associated protein FliL
MDTHEPISPEIPPSESPKTHSNKRLFIILIILMIFLVIFGFGFYFMMNQQGRMTEINL